MWLFKKRTCKNCTGQMMDKTASRLEFWVLICGWGEKSMPIEVADHYDNLSYKTPKWCPKR